MQTPAFRHWLKNSYLQSSGKHLASGTQISRIANCSTIEQIEGDLDEHFNRDGMTSLLDRLSYSSADSEKGNPPKHRISIDGDLANGSTTYRSAANLYRKFRVAQENGIEIELGNEEHETGEPQITPAATERTSLLRSRIGQDKFRYLVLERWDYRCAVTKAGILLTASHIKPWRDSSDTERLDAFNGLCLSPLYDRAFDSGIITFAFDGTLILSSAIPRREAQLLGLTENKRLTGLTSRHRPYLAYHHHHIWRTSGKEDRSRNFPQLRMAK